MFHCGSALTGLLLNDIIGIRIVIGIRLITFSICGERKLRHLLISEISLMSYLGQLVAGYQNSARLG